MSAPLRHCRSCRAEIHWLRNQTTGRWMPVDTEAIPSGNLEADLDAGTVRVLNADQVALARVEGRLLWVSHFATCPQAAGHRRTP